MPRVDPVARLPHGSRRSIWYNVVRFDAWYPRGGIVDIPAVTARLQLVERLVTSAPSPPEVAERGLTRDCLTRSLKHLTEEQQRVILHRLIEGRSNAEVAKLLGKTEGAIKSLQHRALASLRRAVTKERCYEP